MGVPHPIPYQGSKRGLTSSIIRYFPEGQARLIEPFAGSAAVSLAAAYHGKANEFVLNDLNRALIDLWDAILHRPDQLIGRYIELWNAQAGKEREFYDDVRAKFNRTQRPEYLLYLLARCVKASVRYNGKGEFNQSPDNRRRGARPSTMKGHIQTASRLLAGKVSLCSGDYREVVSKAGAADLIYMDPPYQGVCGNRDPRYIGDISFDEFVDTLLYLNRTSISYIVSYDGRNDLQTYGQPLPESLLLTRIELIAGRSTQATLLGLNATTIESLYLSPALVEKLGNAAIQDSDAPCLQPSLFEAVS
ncbi:MAG: DNA adenine methylase [Armatimonadetes bacterium]|nr:DNA adenine methylase [Armatimonadota bacterium]